MEKHYQKATLTHTTSQIIAKHDFTQVINSGAYTTYGRSVYKPGVQYGEVSGWDPRLTLSFAPNERSKRSCSADTVDKLKMPCKNSAWHKCHTRDETLCQGRPTVAPNLIILILPHLILGDEDTRVQPTLSYLKNRSQTGLMVWCWKQHLFLEEPLSSLLLSLLSEQSESSWDRYTS